MQRFFIPLPEKKEEKIFITQPEILHHAKNVLRLKEQEGVVVFDAKGNEYSCLVEEIGERLVLKIKKGNFSQKKAHPVASITVACAIPKKAKMDEIIDKLTQLGVDKIIPLETERVIVKLEAAKKKLRKARWEKIALSAAQQSQRNTIPEVAPVTTLKEVFSEAKNFDLKLLPTLVGQRKKIGEVLLSFPRKRESGGMDSRLNHSGMTVLVLIGPEGDFTDAEVAQAKSFGFIPVSLGDFVLRVDTAAIAVASFLRLNENF